MAYQKKLTDEQERRLVVDHQDGFTAVALAGRYGVSESTVWRILADYRVPVKADWRRKRKPVRAAARGRKLKPCGTNAAYARHKRNGEYPCTACLEAHAAQQKSYYEKKKDKL